MNDNPTNATMIAPNLSDWNPEDSSVAELYQSLAEHVAKISKFKYKLAEISELKDELAEISEFQDELAKISELQDELASKLLGEEEIVETIEAYAGISTSLGRSSSQIVEPLGHDRHLLLVKELKKVNYDYECTICELLSTW